MGIENEKKKKKLLSCHVEFRIVKLKKEEKTDNKTLLHATHQDSLIEQSYIKETKRRKKFLRLLLAFFQETRTFWNNLPTGRSAYSSILGAMIMHEGRSNVILQDF